MKLRSTVAIVTTTMSCVAVVIAVGLVILTSALSQFTARLETSVERVRLLMELESHALEAGRASMLASIDPLLLARSDPP